MSNVSEETGKTVRLALANWGAAARLGFLMLVMASCLLVVGRYTPVCALVRPSAVRVSLSATVAYGSRDHSEHGSSVGVMPRRFTE